MTRHDLARRTAHADQHQAPHYRLAGVSEQTVVDAKVIAMLRSPATKWRRGDNRRPVSRSEARGDCPDRRASPTRSGQG